MTTEQQQEYNFTKWSSGRISTKHYNFVNDNLDTPNRIGYSRTDFNFENPLEIIGNTGVTLLTRCKNGKEAEFKLNQLYFK